MPNYNTQLQSNNTDLQAILNTINELPEAGSGAQATPEISVNSTNGLITATAGVKSSTYQLAFQPAKTITPKTTDQVAVSSGYYTGGVIKVKGDANLVAGNIKSGVSIFGVSGTLEEGSVSTEVVEYSENEDAMVTGTLSSYYNDRVTTIGDNVFYYCSNLTSVNFPAVTTIGKNAFYRCDNLTTANFPAATTIGNQAFCSCSNLTTVSFPVARTIDTDAFESCNNLTTANFPAATTIGSAAFCSCSNLTTVSFPVARTIAENGFRSCYNLTTVSFPALTTIKYNTFYHCYNLTAANFPACTSIANSAFYCCDNLITLCLPGSTLCRLSTSNALSSTPFRGYKASFIGTPHIYVPASLVSAYQSATNWTYFSKYFSSIESLGSNLIIFTISGTKFQAEEGMTWGEWIESQYNITTINFTFDENGKITTSEGYFLVEPSGNDGYYTVFNNTLIRDGAIYNLIK